MAELEAQRCPKCGTGNPIVNYHGVNSMKQTPCQAGTALGWNTRSTAEHLHYVCQRCRYDWTTPPLDAAQQPS